MKISNLHIAKVTPPRVSSSYPRKRLFQLLDSYRNQPVIWVSSPAGSGKTTLIASYIDSCNLPCLWYKLDAADNDIATFFYCAGLAVKKNVPGFRKSLPLLSPEYLKGIKEFTKRYFEEVYRRLRSPFVLVFDNYQEVQSDALLHEVLQTGISIIPDGIQIIIISRNEPPPIFIRLRMERFKLIGWNDIRLTAEETKDLSILLGKQDLDQSNLIFLHEKTRGWIAGLILFFQSSNTRVPDSHVLDNLAPQDIFDYFAIEVFSKADNETQELLLKTAILPAMTVQMAEDLTGIKSVRQILSWLERNHYFVEKRLQTSAVYSYHPLFRDFLLSRAEVALPPDEKARLRYDAATLLIDAGQADEAAMLLLAAGDLSRFTLLLLDQAKSLVVHGRLKTLSDWLDVIPQKMKEETPWLLYWLAVCQLGHNSTNSLESFTNAFHLFEERADLTGSFLAWSGAVNTIFCVFDDFKQMDAWIKWLEEKMSIGISFPSLEVEVNVASSMALALITRMPDHPDLRKWVNRTLSLILEGVSLQTCLPMFPFFIYYFVFIGDFDDCNIAVSDLRRLVQAQPTSPLLVITLRFAEAMLYSTSAARHQEGIKAALDGLDLAEKSGAHFLDSLLLALGTCNALNAMDTVRAREFLSRMEKNVRSGSRGQSAHYFCLSGWHAICEGNKTLALTLAQKSTQITEELGLVGPEFDCRFLLAFANLEAEHWHEAVKQLEMLKIFALKTGSTIHEYRCYLLAAYFAFLQNDNKDGMVLLVRAMTLGRQKGFFNNVNFYQPAIMSSLCARALEAGIETEYVQNLIRILNLVPESSTVEIKNWPWLVNIVSFGCFRVERAGKVLEYTAKAPQKILMLLKALISCGQGGASAKQLAYMLWPDADGDLALKTLEISLHRLRKLLGDNRVVCLRDGSITLAPNYCRVDAHRFENLLDHAEEIFAVPRMQNSVEDSRSSEGSHMLRCAINIYTGAFIDGTTEPWALSYRERLRSKFIRAVNLLGNTYQQQKYFDEAIFWYMRGLEIEEGAESFYRGLIRCHLSLGQHAEATAVYCRCKNTLVSIFGVQPSPETNSLIKTVHTL